MDTTEMRRYVANILDQLQRVGRYEENGVVLHVDNGTYRVDGRCSGYQGPRPCALRYFLREACQCPRDVASVRPPYSLAYRWRGCGSERPC
jgi:hypothetical protein